MIAELVDSMGNWLRVVDAARVSYGNRRAVGDKQDARLVHFLLRHRHHSPLEHVVLTFYVEAPIYVARQHMRHRTWSFNEQSRRYDSSTPYFQPSGYEQLDDEICKATFTYEKLKEVYGTERARDVLPMATMTRYYATVDLRNFFHFYMLRSSSEAQAEMRELAGLMWGQLPHDELGPVLEAFGIYALDGVQRLASEAVIELTHSGKPIESDTITEYVRERYAEMYGGDIAWKGAARDVLEFLGFGILF